MTNIRTTDRRQRRLPRSVATTMPVCAYFTVVGAVLIALLFLADAQLEKRGPLWFSNDFTGLPKPWRSETQNLIANPEPFVEVLRGTTMRGPDAEVFK